VTVQRTRPQPPDAAVSEAMRACTGTQEEVSAFLAGLGRDTPSTPPS
jgi:hypothetical protein